MNKLILNIQAELTRRMFNILIAIDQFIFVAITLGGASPDETMSSAAYKTEQNGRFFGFMRPVIDTLALLFCSVDHCHRAYLSEIYGEQLPKDYK